MVIVWVFGGDGPGQAHRAVSTHPAWLTFSSPSPGVEGQRAQRSTLRRKLSPNLQWLCDVGRVHTLWACSSLNGGMISRLTSSQEMRPLKVMCKL